MRCVFWALVLGAASPAWAYEVLLTPDGDPVRWPSMPVEYAINDAGPRHLERAEADAMVHEAFASWARACEGVVARFRGAVADPSTDYHPGHPDRALNVVHFVGAEDRLTSGQLAFTVVRFDVATGDIVNAHIFLDEDMHEFGPDGPAYDVQSTLVHEVGHFLGLDHSDDAGAVMHSGLQRGASRTVGTDDALAARWLYDGPPREADLPEDAPAMACASVDGELGPWWLLLLIVRRRR